MKKPDGASKRMPGVVKRIILNASRWRGQLIIATVTLLMVTAINLATPMFARQMLGLLEAGDTAASRRTIWILAAGLLGLYLLRILMQFLSNYCAHAAAWNSVAKMRARLYDHMQGLSPSFYSDKQTGALLSRVIEDTANFEMLIAHALPELITSILTFAGVLGLLFYLNPLLALITCAPLPLIAGCSVFVRKMHKHFHKRQEISAELNGILQDNFSGIKEVQLFNRRRYETGRIRAKAEGHARQTMKGIFWISLLHPIVGFLSGLGTLFVVLFGGLFALSGSIAAADITAFLMYLALFYTPVAQFARILEDLQTARVSGKRVFEIMDTESEIKDAPGARDAGALSGAVEYKDVSFCYDGDCGKESAVAVLKDFSFSADAGQMIALVGPTGAGKSTVTSLLCRFYDPSAGAVLIDGIDIKDLTVESLRRQISVVPQDVFLFNGTIAENIAYGSETEAPREEIVRAAQTAAVDEFIASLPAGYDTRVGERGMRLSGGQKQRIALARAVLRNAPILVLDEATSAIDNETEREIQAAIDAIAGKRTVIAIAHRLSTVERADLILVLADGKIIERGTHAQLLAQNGAYASMHKAGAVN